MTDVDEHDTIRRSPAAASVAFAGAVPDDADTVLRPPAAAARADASADAPDRSRDTSSDGADPRRPQHDGAPDDADAADGEPVVADPLCFRVVAGATTMVLDEDVHIGRNPRSPRAGEGGPVRLLRVESPSGVISGSHLGLRRVGSTAVAVDLMSTNGTVVRLPGFAPRRLRQGESLVTPPGTRLEIGEGILIEVIERGGLG